MNKFELSALIGLCVALILSAAASFDATCDGLRGEVFRLHILANSDSAEDQALKLRVRDRLLEKSGELFSGAGSADEAMAAAAENLDAIGTLVAEVIEESGYDYGAECEIVNMRFNDREYDSIVMPQGDYNALRIKIGEAEGQNWWCVMYPPLCLPAVTDMDEYFTDEEISILTEHDEYEIKFKLAELFSRLKELLESRF